MTANEFRAVTDFEGHLEPGAPVWVHWTNCHHQLAAMAVVHKVNTQSIVCRLVVDYAAPHGHYYAGQLIRVPRLAPGSGMKQWSDNNRVTARKVTTF